MTENGVDFLGKVNAVLKKVADFLGKVGGFFQ